MVQKKELMILLPKLASLWLLLLSIQHCWVSMASDPDPVQDYCVADPKFNSNIRTHRSLSILPCKNSSEVTTEDFIFSGMKGAVPNFSDTGLFVISANPTAFPGLNTLGMSFSRAEIRAGGFNPPHFHPRATEMAFLVKGRLYSGFVDSGNRVFARVMEAGEVMVYPRGLVHFQMNVGDKPAVVFGSFNSQNPGVQKIPAAIFGSGIKEELLEKAFGLSSREIGIMRRRLDPKKPR